MGQNNAALYPEEILKMQNMFVKGISVNKQVEESKKRATKTLLEIMDRQDAKSRYKWYNLPYGLNADLLERALYHKGQGMLFKLGDKFYFLPFTLSSNKSTGIDCYGRYTCATPVSMGATDDQDGKQIIKGAIYNINYDIALTDYSEAQQQRQCVILNDYTQGVSPTNIGRADLQKDIIDTMSEMIPFMRTALISKCGVRSMRVPDSTASGNVTSANLLIKSAALKGELFIPMESQQEFQDMSGGQNTANASEFMAAFQSLDNLRKRSLGIKTDGLLQKNQHVLSSEQDLNESSGDAQFDDGLFQRQMFCLIAESIWHLGMWCEANDHEEKQNAVMGGDNDGRDSISEDSIEE